MGLFAKTDKDNIQRCLDFLSRMNQEMYDMMKDMMDKKYGFNPDTVSLPLLLIFAEAAGTNTGYPGRKKLLNHMVAKIARTPDEMVHTTYQKVRGMYRNSVVHGIMGEGDFFYDDFDELDTSNSMYRMAFSATGLMYDSLLSVDEFSEEELDEIRDRYTDFFYDFGEYLDDRYEEFCGLLKEYGN